MVMVRLQAVHDSNNTQKYIILYSTCILNLSALTSQNAHCQFSERDLCLLQLEARLCFFGEYFWVVVAWKFVFNWMCFFLYPIWNWVKKNTNGTDWFQINGDVFIFNSRFIHFFSCWHVLLTADIGNKDLVTAQWITCNIGGVCFIEIDEEWETWSVTV